MSFDLNLVYGGGDDSTTCDEEDETMIVVMEDEGLNGSGTQMMDDSGTSISSIVNAEEASNNGIGEENSNSNSNSNNTFPTTFTFDILKTEAKADTSPYHTAMPTTKDLLNGGGGDDKGGGGIMWEFSSGSSLIPAMKPQWLNLSLADSSGGGFDLRVMQQQQQQQKLRKSRRGPRSRSSQYRGVTFYRRTGRWESHIWDCGKQVYLGGFDTAHTAARAYDRAAIKFRGVDADINFNTSDYDEDMKQMKHLSKEEFVYILRRRSTGFARGSSKYRGVTLHKCGRWEARMGQLPGKKAYDKAAIECIGREAVTNFEPRTYQGEIILESNNGGNGGNLDLSLGISIPSQKRNGIVGHYHVRCADCEVSIRERHLVETSASAAAAGVQISSSLVMAAKHPSAFSGLYPNFLSDNEEIAKKKKAEAVSLPRFSNWSWKMQGHGDMRKTTPAHQPLFNAAAASSGFSSPPISTTSAIPPLLYTKNETAHNMPY